MALIARPPPEVPLPSSLYGCSLRTDSHTYVGDRYGVPSERKRNGEGTATPDAPATPGARPGRDGSRQQGDRERARHRSAGGQGARVDAPAPVRCLEPPGARGDPDAAADPRHDRWRRELAPLSLRRG